MTEDIGPAERLAGLARVAYASGPGFAQAQMRKLSDDALAGIILLAESLVEQLRREASCRRLSGQPLELEIRPDGRYSPDSLTSLDDLA
jgi:vacuolar-type H+-ATPase subunit F/Vma7